MPMLDLSPAQVIQKLYDTAIQACERKNFSLAQRAITELIMALDFEQGDLPMGLFQLYDYCKQCIRKGNSEEAVSILTELRNTWTKALELN